MPFADSTTPPPAWAVGSPAVGSPAVGSLRSLRRRTPRPTRAPAGSEPDPHDWARQIVLRQLTAAPRSRAQLEQALRRKELPRRRRRGGARPDGGGRARRRHRLRRDARALPAGRPRAGPSRPGAGAAPQGRRRRDRAGRPRRGRPARRGGPRPRARREEDALDVGARPGRADPPARRDARPQGVPRPTLAMRIVREAVREAPEHQRD